MSTVVTKDSFKWFTQCKLKYNASDFPCHCEPWHDNWGDPLLPEADCSKCEVAKKYGYIPETEIEDSRID